MSILSSVGDFALGFANERPVYVGATKIGYWKQDPSSLCKGVIYIENAEAAKADPSTWTTKDDLWRDIPVNQFCVSAGLTPPWMTAAQVAATPTPAGANITTGLVTKVDTALSAALNSGNLIKWGLIGGVGIVALYLVMRER